MERPFFPARTMPLSRLSLFRRTTCTAALACVPLAPLRAQLPAELAPAAWATPPTTGLPPYAPVRHGTDLLPLPGTLDVGVSVGTARTSRWYDAGTEAGTVEGGTALSAEVRYWPVPWVGLRLQAGRFDGEIRTQDCGGPFGCIEQSQELRGTTVDASVVVRPLAGSGVPAPLSTVYAFHGAGVAWLRLSGESDRVVACDGIMSCRAHLPVSGTVRQVTTGVGADLVRVGRFGVFAEASLHRYRPEFESSPVMPPLPPDPQFGARHALTSAPPVWTVGTVQSPAALNQVVTRRLAAGVRINTGRAGGLPPLPSPPPTAPSTGGYLTVITTTPGADVYLIPLTYYEEHQNIDCQLQAGGGSFHRGWTPATFSVDNRTHVLIVRQGRRQYKNKNIQLSGGEENTIRLDMAFHGLPDSCP
jgi:hypothetical protein